MPRKPVIKTGNQALLFITIWVVAATLLATLPHHCSKPAEGSKEAQRAAARPVGLSVERSNRHEAESRTNRDESRTQPKPQHNNQ